jgi:hypothetical protein
MFESVLVRCCGEMLMISNSLLRQATTPRIHIKTACGRFSQPKQQHLPYDLRQLFSER